MLLTDANVLIYAFWKGAPRHREYRRWLQSALEAPEAFGYSELVLSSVVRIVTHPRVFDPPTPIGRAIEFVESVRGASNAVRISPGEAHWETFAGLCRRVGARGNTVPDAYLAALAIESGADWITTDRGYSRFPGLRMRHPLE